MFLGSDIAYCLQSLNIKRELPLNFFQVFNFGKILCALSWYINLITSAPVCTV